MRSELFTWNEQNVVILLKVSEILIYILSLIIVRSFFFIFVVRAISSFILSCTETRHGVLFFDSDNLLVLVFNFLFIFLFVFARVFQVFTHLLLNFFLSNFPSNVFTLLKSSQIVFSLCSIPNQLGFTLTVSSNLLNVITSLFTGIPLQFVRNTCALLHLWWPNFVFLTHFI